jgi:hypothetical protein
LPADDGTMLELDEDEGIAHQALERLRSLRHYLPFFGRRKD